MRDLLLALFLLSAFPVILYRFQVGAMVIGFISFMYPQSNAYGFALSFQWLDIILVLTVAGYILQKGYKDYQHHWGASYLLFFYGWTCLSTIFAIDSDFSQVSWVKFSKILILAYVVYMMIGNKIRLNAFMKVMVISLGFYGIKGGLFTILTGGGHTVLGPINSFFADNNRTALVLVMVLPFSIFFINHAENIIQRYFAIFCSLMTAVAILGTHSRTGFVALAATLVYYTWLQKKLFRSLLILVPIAGVALFFMPSVWTDRMATTTDLETDGSFQGRVDMWKASLRIANDNPIFGAGFEAIYVPEVHARYIPPDVQARAIHSSYFEMMAEHGYAGFIFYMILLGAAFLIANKVVKLSKDTPEADWYRDLSITIRSSLAAYMVMSLTANIAFFDLLYFVFIINLTAHNILLKKTSDKPVQHDHVRPAYT